jgi:hypothetical protein
MTVFPGFVGAPLVAPDSISNLVATAASTTSISLTFTSAPHATSHEEQHSPAGMNSWSTAAGISSADTVTGLSLGTSYDFQVRGVNTLGAGSWSSTVTKSTKGTPSTISNLAASAASSSALNVTYTAATDADSYEERHRLTVGPGSWIGPATLVADQITGLSASTGYDVEIRGVNDGSTGSFSNTASATTSAAALGNITDLAVSQVDTDTLTLTFTASSGAATHEYRWSPCIRQTGTHISTGLWTAWTALGGGSGTSIDVPYPQCKYDVQVRGANGATKGAESNTAQQSTATPTLASATISNITASGNAYIDSGIYLGAKKWSSPVSYSFPTSGSYYHGSSGTSSDYAAGENLNHFEVCSNSNKDAVYFGIFWIMLHTGLRFYEVTETDTDHADIRCARSGTPFTSYASSPSTSVFYRGDIWIGNGQGGGFNTSTTSNPGDYSFYVHNHELGHAVGLSHHHDNTGLGSTSMPHSGDGSSSDFDCLEFTIMSYRDFRGDAVDGITAPHPWMYGMYDIAALQQIYGTNTYATGDTTHTFNSSNGTYSINGNAIRNYSNKLCVTICDKGGTDTIDISNYAGQDVTLTAGATSLISTTQRISVEGGNYVGNIHIGLNGTIDAKITA